MMPVQRLIRALSIGLVAGLAGYITWDRVETYRLNRGIKAIAARGEPIDLSILDAAPATARQEEAAHLYADAAARAREMTQQDGRLTRVDVDAVIGRLDVREIEASFRIDAPALQLLDRATPLPFAGFWDVVEVPQWENTAGLQSLAGLAALRADLQAYRGNGDAAAASLAAAVRVQRTLPELFPRNLLMVRQVGSLRVLLRHAAPSVASLESLQRAFADLPDEDGLEQELMRHRARLTDLRLDGTQPFGLPAVLRFLFHPFLVRTLRVQIEQFPELMSIARQPWPDKIGPWTAIAATTTGPAAGRNILRRTLVGPTVNMAALSASPMMAGQALAGRRLAVTTLAVERYRRSHAGAPPADLASLVPALLPAVPLDPFSGKPFIYRPSPDGYLLYGVDINRVDDGGKLYGLGSLNPMPLPRVRDFGINVPLTPRPVRE